jgi:hypothetical protein
MFRSSLDGSGERYMVGRVGFQFTEAFHRWSATKVSMMPSADVRTAAYLRCSPAEKPSAMVTRERDDEDAREDALEPPTASGLVVNCGVRCIQIRNGHYDEHCNVPGK